MWATIAFFSRSERAAHASPMAQSPARTRFHAPGKGFLLLPRQQPPPSAVRFSMILEITSAKGGPAIYENGAMAVPISLVPNTPSTSAKTSLAELDRRGEFLAPVTKSGLIGFAQLD